MCDEINISLCLCKRSRLFRDGAPEIIYYYYYYYYYILPPTAVLLGRQSGSSGTPASGISIMEFVMSWRFAIAESSLHMGLLTQPSICCNHDILARDNKMPMVATTAAFDWSQETRAKAMTDFRSWSYDWLHDVQSIAMENDRDLGATAGRLIVWRRLQTWPDTCRR